MVRQVIVIYKKELKEALRDYHALLTVFLVPSFFLVVMFIGIHFVVDLRESSSRFELPVSGAGNAEPIIAWLKEEGITVVDAPSDPVAAVKLGENDIVLIIPDDFPKQFAAMKKATLELIYDSSNQKVQVQINRLRNLIAQWGSRINGLRLIDRGVSPRVLASIELEDHDVANSQKVASGVLNGLPMIIMIVIFASGIGVSVDMMAGERERNSLEALLLNPVSRTCILLGKWGTSFTLTMVVFEIYLVVLYFFIPALPLEELGLKYRITVTDLAIITITAIPLALLATMLQLFISIFTNSFKEAQSYLTFIVLLPVIPYIYSLTSSGQNEILGYLVPILGQQLIVSDVMAGEGATAFQIACSSIGTLVITSLIALGTIKQIKREKIIYG